MHYLFFKKLLNTKMDINGSNNDATRIPSVVTEELAEPEITHISAF